GTDPPHRGSRGHAAQHRLQRRRGNLPLVPGQYRLRRAPRARTRHRTGRGRLAGREDSLMLLTRLAEHAAHRSDLPPPYYRNRTIRWVINIRPDGTPAAPGLQDQAGRDQPAGQPLPAPYVYRSGQRPPAVLLVDTLQ